VRQEDYREEECGTYDALSGAELIEEIHRRYRPYLTGSFDSRSPIDFLLTQANALKVAEKISQIDAEHTELLNTLGERQFNAVALPVVTRWAAPMALWYGIGFTAAWWRPFFIARRQLVGGTILILGAGSLVSGMMDSDSFAGGLGAMMLVGGFLIWKSGPGAPQKTLQ
jgi:hypothetical protein